MFVAIKQKCTRCGKSTLLHQLLSKKYPGAVYLNFEDPRSYDFEKNDFNRLDTAVKNADSKVLFFDEIQIVDQWERYVRQKLDEGFRIVESTQLIQVCADLTPDNLDRELNGL